jgi:hypothetical protein
MKLIKNIIEQLAKVGGVYVALQEPFIRGYVFTIIKMDKLLCYRNGGQHELKCPFNGAEERVNKCLGVIAYCYADEGGTRNYKCLAHVRKRFRTATPSERERLIVDV